MSIRLAILSLLLCCSIRPAIADPISDAEETKLVDAIRATKTADGSTVGAVLKDAERLRSKKFKLAEISSSYDAQRNYIGFSICFFIGAERSKGDDYCDIRLNVDRKTLVVGLREGSADKQYDRETRALLEGRTAFLAAVDARYADKCIDQGKKKTFC